MALTHFISGETFVLRRKVTPNAAITVYFSGPEKHELTEHTADESGCVEVVQPTDGWKSGNYILEVWQSVDGIKTVISRQSVTILPAATDIEVGQDVRSVAEKIVANIESLMAGTGSQTVKRYRINNRELQNYDASELLAMLHYWRNRLARLNRRERGDNRLGSRIVFKI